jgi:hypothetical protein
MKKIENIKSRFANMNVRVLIMALAIGMFAVSCDEEDDEKYNFGTNPVLPSYSKTAPEDEAALVATLKANGYANAYFDEDDGCVYATKTEGNREYVFMGCNTALPEGAKEAKYWQDMFEEFLGFEKDHPEDLKAVLKKNGWTDFNISATAMSWSEKDDTYSIGVYDDWLLIEIIENKK